MIYWEKELITTSLISEMRYLGSTNSPNPLMTISALNCVVIGASADLSAQLQIAVIKTPANQSIKPTNTDFITLDTFTSNTIKSYLTLNGCWVRFVAINSGLPAVLTCMLE